MIFVVTPRDVIGLGVLALVVLALIGARIWDAVDRRRARPRRGRGG